MAVVVRSNGKMSSSRMSNGKLSNGGPALSVSPYGSPQHQGSYNKFASRHIGSINDGRWRKTSSCLYREAEFCEVDKLNVAPRRVALVYV